MGWEAASWLMDTSGPASFRGPASFTPDDDTPELEDESPYVDNWRRRVDDGSIDWAAECDAGNVDIMSMIPLDWWDGGKS